MNFADYLTQKLAAIKGRGLYREPKYLASPQGPRVMIEGREFLLFSSNSYLGLCSDPRLKQAAYEAIASYGVGTGGSRLTTGSYEIHRQLEREVAHLKGTERALVFNTGYMANVGTISALAGPEWVIFSDELNHASIVDGCRLSEGEVVIYAHGDVKDLKEKMAHYRGRPALIVTDGVFSVDGDMAPLDDLVALAREEKAVLMVDDAHATGVLGPHGGGTADLFNLSQEIDIQMGTFSKALASEGGFIAGKGVLIEYLINKARSFIFSTALNPASCAVSLAALSIVKSEPERRRELLEKARWMREKLVAIGLPVLKGETPIIPIIIGEATQTVEFSQRLWQRGIFIPALRPPTVKAGTSRLRISLMATHTWEDLQSTVEAIGEVAREMKLRGKGP
ncbi:MAG TPA: 8-amino-7-oxononanoate synthase [Syntrophales bacterium]|nr:8-amino-7-oxononanoate synthase [Syntrophales bacterium]HOL58385.1 8-amino-7-oxononanoate synthase [Syntrophales bacterium]HPO34554.1 8-amino-7-oxononanoate synthase [Syntrophales bacterium]